MRILIFAALGAVLGLLALGLYCRGRSNGDCLNFADRAHWRY